MIKVIVFDFDGVLVDSNSLKREAFFDLFAGRESVTREMVEAAWEERGGYTITRFEFLELVFSKLKKPESEKPGFVKKYADEYDEIVQGKIKKGGMAAGVPSVLQALAEKYALYINSATPEFALKRTAKELGIDKFFKGIFGVMIAGFRSIGDSKIENLEKIMSLEKASGDETAYVGDGEADLAAASKLKCHFIGIPNELNGWPEKADFTTINSVSVLPEAVKQIK